MDNDQIVPSILEEVPPSKITITYPNGKTVNFGEELSPKDVKIAPEVKWEADPQKYYTLLMIDPDAPSPRHPFLGEVNHWLVGNVMGCNLSAENVITEYAGAGPPRSTGPHRYIFVVFEHEYPVTFDASLSKKGLMNRLRFSIKEFRKKYELDKVFAWNYFKAQWRSKDGKTHQELGTCVLL